MIGQFTRFIVVGGVGLLVSMGITYVEVQYMDMWYLWAYGISVLISWTIIFIGNATITFPDHKRYLYQKKYLSFMGGYLVLFWVNALFVYIFTSLMSFHYLISIVLATIITTALTFSFNKQYIFH